MRVIAGSARRMPLATPAGDATRPTQDRIKETLFNMIQNEVPGCVFADVCCGSGGIGIEALSRGARKAYFLENAGEPLRFLTQNLEKTHLKENAVIIKGDAPVQLRNIRDELDIIYLDPPYQSDIYVRALASLADSPAVTEYTRIIAETAGDADFTFAEEMGFVIEREKEYRHNKHIFLRRRQTGRT